MKCAPHGLVDTIAIAFINHVVQYVNNLAQSIILCQSGSETKSPIVPQSIKGCSENNGKSVEA